MPAGKFDLPEILPSVKSIPESDSEKFHLGLNEEVKEQGVAGNSIPLSPQWLYSKPSDGKMDGRAPAAFTVNESYPREGWKVEGSEEKKDWRRSATENEANRRWREEEREAGLLATRDRRKADRRVDNVSNREETKNVPTNDRWNDASVRNSHSKWSSRWGPEDKEKEFPKKLDTEKEKEKEKEKERDDKELDSRDKWRPRHKMDAHSVGTFPPRGAPGFGGRVEGSDAGFTLGRGKLISNGRRAFINDSNSIPENFIKMTSTSVHKFRYPRGKLIDIYRRCKSDPSFNAIPEEMEAVPSLTQVESSTPLAFLPPELEEEAALTEMWKGKMTSSEVMYKSDKSNDIHSGKNSNDSIESKLSNQPVDVGKVIGDFSENPPNLVENSSNGERDDIRKGLGTKNHANEPRTKDAESRSSVYSGFEPVSDALQLSAVSMDGHVIHSPSRENETLTEDSYILYVDPSGNIQGPFLGADIITWFEEGYFGLDLPVRNADASEEVHFQSLGSLMPFLKTKNELSDSNVTLPNNPSSFVANYPHPFEDSSTHSTTHPAKSESEFSSHLQYSDAPNFLDNSTEDEEIIYPGSLSFSPQDNLPKPVENKIHPFGLLWSELEGSSETPQNMARNAYPSSNEWAEFPRNDTRPSRFDVEEHLMAQQIHSRNGLPPRGHHTATDLEQLVALQLHQQRQLQLQQQLQIHRMQQQQLIEERQEIQARQVLLEQLMHLDPNVTDQLLMQQLLQRDHRYALPSDHLARLKYASQQRELYDLLQRNHLEQQILQERQMSMERVPFDHTGRKTHGSSDQEMYQWNQRVNLEDHLIRAQSFHERTGRWDDGSLQQLPDWADGRPSEPGLWMSSEDKARQLLMDLLHQKSTKEELFYDQRIPDAGNFGGFPGDQQELALKNYYNTDPRSRNTSPGISGPPVGTGGFDMPEDRPMMSAADGRPDGAGRSRSALMSTDGGDTKRDGVFRRAASACSDSDSSEPSFIEMLKSGAKKGMTSENGESADAAQSTRNAKKKGKKGRQIDPALLGFKVTSNRIMMGEIQRIED